jgi:hypothetical protein
LAGTPNPKAPIVLNEGPILMTVHPVEWRALSGAASLSPGLDVALLSLDDPPGDALAAASPDLLTSLYGKRLRLVEVQFCYDATGDGVTLDEFLMRVDRNTTGTTNSNPVAAAVDTTDRTDRACRSYSVDWVLDPGDMAAAGVKVHFDSEATGTFDIGRLTFVLEPTDEPT